MRKKNIASGDTFIARINEAMAGVGVVIDHSNTDVKVVFLAVFTDCKEDDCEQGDLFTPPREVLSFPTYMDVPEFAVSPYTFSREIQLCKHSSRLHVRQPAIVDVEKYFHINNTSVLSYIDMARHIIGGGDVNNYIAWKSFRPEVFFLIWAVLYRHFPDRVKIPPKEWEYHGGARYIRIHNMDSDRDPTVELGSRD